MRIVIVAATALLLLTAPAAPALTTKTPAPPACKPTHCRESWVLKAGTARVVKSPEPMTAGLPLRFNIYGNGRMVHELAQPEGGIVLMDDRLLILMESPGNGPFVARLANFSRHRVRVTIDYWQMSLH